MNNDEGSPVGQGRRTVNGPDSAWDRMELRLAAYLSTMTDPDEQDHLVLNAPGGADAGAPYAQFAGFGDGEALRAELSGNAYLAPAHRLGTEMLAHLRFLGWEGGDESEPNLFISWSVDDAQTLAGMVVWALREDFHVPHPGLLSARAWGPATSAVSVLGLPLAEEVPTDVVDLYRAPSAGAAFAAEMEAAQLLSVPVSGYEQLTGLVGAALEERLGVAPQVDEDGDFVLSHGGQPVWVRIRKDQPAIAVIARVVHDVHSRRQTALELALLNRDHDWVKWTLHERAVFQTVLVPGYPFARQVFDGLLDAFLEAMSSTRDDLALRVGGRIA